MRKRGHQDRGPAVELRDLFLVLCAAIAGFALAGVVGAQDAANRAFQGQLEHFQWIVLVEGDPIEIDEVGILLERNESVRQTTFFAGNQALERLTAGSPLAQEVHRLLPDLVPASWVVQFSPERLRFPHLADLRADVLRLPGVIEVAYDERSLVAMDVTQGVGNRLRLLKSATITGLTALVLLFLAKLVFFRRGRWPARRRSSYLTVIHAAGWGVGVLLAHQAIAPVPWALALGGLLIGAMHSVWPVLWRTSGEA